MTAPTTPASNVPAMIECSVEDEVRSAIAAAMFDLHGISMPRAVSIVEIFPRGGERAPY